MPLEGIPLREEKREMTEAICPIRTSSAVKVQSDRDISPASRAAPSRSSIGTNDETNRL